MMRLTASILLLGVLAVIGNTLWTADELLKLIDGDRLVEK